MTTVSSDSFRVTKRERVFDVEKFRVDKCTIQLPTGESVQWTTRHGGDLFIGVPITDGKVLMTKEWRLGPEKVVTQFTRAKADLDELKRELKEELGIVGGDYNKLINYSYSRGNKTTGFMTIYTVEKFSLDTTNRDEHEIQEVVELPIKGLFSEFIANHVVDAETLLIAKLLEEQRG